MSEMGTRQLTRPGDRHKGCQKHLRAQLDRPMTGGQAGRGLHKPTPLTPGSLPPRRFFQLGLCAGRWSEEGRSSSPAGPRLPCSWWWNVLSAGETLLLRLGERGKERKASERCLQEQSPASERPETESTGGRPTPTLQTGPLPDTDRPQVWLLRGGGGWHSRAWGCLWT